MKLGILGYPLGYSLSPLIHRRALAHAGLEGEYRECPVGPEDLWGWLGQVKELGLAGFNVTMPYKKSVFAWVVGEGAGRLGRQEAADGAIGAINTVVMDSGRPIGYNTDGIGFLRTLIDKPRALDIGGWHVVLLGAGGAAQAIAVTLAMETKIGRLTIWSRHPVRAKELSDRVNGLRSGGRGSRFSETVEDLETLPVQQCQLLVNATPVGMTPPPRSGGGVKGKRERLVDLDRLHGGQVVYDLVYEPRDTELICGARERGCRVVTGDEMLAGQAAVSFQLWTGVKGMLPVMRQALDDYFTSR